jgi:anti-sigma B factor antagonist
MTQDDSITVAVQQAMAGCLQVDVGGTLTRGTDAAIKGQLGATPPATNEHRTVLLNLSDVGFMDSAGISSLLSLHHHLMEIGDKLVLCNVPPRINQMFEVVGMSRLIPVADTPQQAREICQA